MLAARAPRYALAGSGPVVVDASIAFLWFVNEPEGRRAARLLETEAPLLAPDLLAVEVTNAWGKKLRRREMEAADERLRRAAGRLGLRLW